MVKAMYALPEELIRSHIFDADDLSCMSYVLNSVFTQRHLPEGHPGREALAERIIGLYANGTRDPDLLESVLMRCRL
jgi:hypothetical protein